VEVAARRRNIVSTCGEKAGTLTTARAGLSRPLPFSDFFSAGDNDLVQKQK